VVSFDLNGSVPDKLAELGVGLVGGSCTWGDLEPARRVFDWRCSDTVIVGAQKLGMRSAMTIVCTPGWANGGAGCNAMPDDATDWYDFVANYVQHYSRYDTVLGVWNEPNLTLRDNGESYALLYVNASNARNKVNPRFVIAGPQTSHHALTSGYLAHSLDIIESFHAMNPLDPVAVHWYPDGPPVLDYLDAVRAMAGYHPVWLSETGFPSIDVAAQAQFYTTMLNYFTYGGRPWWTHISFYRLWDNQDCCTESILGANYTHKPAFDAYRDWIAQHIADGPADDRTMTASSTLH
jgi:hypothetical protein